MPQAPIEMPAAKAEKMFHIIITDAPAPKLTVAEARAEANRPWWSRRLRWGWRRNLAAIEAQRL